MRNGTFEPAGDVERISIEHLQQLWKGRQSGLDRGVPTEAFRLLDGGADGCPGLMIDVIGSQWVVHTQDRDLPDGFQAAVDAGLCRAVWWKRLDRQGRAAPACIAGEGVEVDQVSEAGLRYEVQPGAGYNFGLFLDQRLNRARVREEVKEGDRILNLFSYTCSFSVSAVAAGGVVTSVDLNAGYLEWGKRNMSANDLDPQAHYWIKGDSFDWLAAFAKKGRRFDGVVLDPPTFSRGTKKRVFKVERDYAELVSLTASVMESGGWLLASANTHRQNRLEFEQQVLEGLERAGVTPADTRWLPMPEDFPGSDYLKCLWVRLAG